MGAQYSKGTIRKKQKANGSWEWQGFICVTRNGKKKQLTKMTGIACDPAGDTKRGSNPAPAGKGAQTALKVVERWRDELVSQEAVVTPSVPDEPIHDFMERYLKTLNVEPGTLQNYKYLLNHIDLLGCTLQELTAQRVEAWKLEMAERDIGAHMRNKAFNLLKYACKWGVRIEALPKNPCDYVKAPPRPKHEPNPLDPAELPRMVELLNDLKQSKPEFADLALLAVNTGMRRGELCALRWSDIDGYRDGTFTGCIHVNRVVATKAGGTYIKDYPKNGNRRQVNINDNIRAILTRRRNALSEVVSDLSECFVFAMQASPDSYFSPDYATKLWNMFASVNGFVGVEGRPLRFHDLRDTFATSALVNDVPVITVAAILGHENANTTNKHYSHFIPSKNKEAMDFMSRLLNAS